jgi:hypothetical protein
MNSYQSPIEPNNDDPSGRIRARFARILDHQWCIVAFAIAALSNLVPGLIAQEVSGRPNKPTGAPAEPLPEYIQKVKVVRAEGDESVAPLAPALFKYSDSARIIADGAVWAWSDGGRPVAMAKCWKNANGTQTCAFSLTSDALVVAEGPQMKTWQPEKMQIDPVELTGAPSPDAKDAIRLRQLKEQSRRFAAHEFWNPENDRYELRLLPQPVLRYRDEKRRINDGAVFLLAYDNNPQILLFLEIVGADEGKVRWQYSLARVSSADLHVLLDGKEVWSQPKTPGIIGKPTDFYWHMVTRPEEGDTERPEVATPARPQGRGDR